MAEIQVSALEKYIRMSPRKMRLVCDLVKGKQVDAALQVLKMTTKAAAKPMAKAIQSAAANAENTFGMSRSDLHIANAIANEGPTLKRFKAGARGRGKPIEHKTTHLTVSVEERS